VAGGNIHRPSLRPTSSLLVFVAGVLIIGQVLSFVPGEDPSLIVALWILNLTFFVLPFVYRGYRNDQQQKLNHWAARPAVDGRSILYLRPFMTAGRLYVRCSVRSVAERFLYGPRWDLEMALSHAAAPDSQLVAIGDVKGGFGAAKFKTSDEQWKQVLERLATSADLILIVPLPRPSTLWELEQVLGQPEFKKKTIVVMPPTFLGPTIRGWFLRRRSPRALWKQSQKLVAERGIALPDYRREGALLVPSGDEFTRLDAWKFQPDYLNRLFTAGADAVRADQDLASRLVAVSRNPGVRRMRFLLINRSYSAGVYAILLALLFRSLVLQPFSLPTASMQSTLMIGDYFAVSKLDWGIGSHSLPVPIQVDGRVLGFATPERGDVVVFYNQVTGEDYVTRIIGAPGDSLQMRAGRLYLNGELVDRQEVGRRVDQDSTGYDVPVIQYQETLPGGRSYIIQEVSDDQMLDETRQYDVPAGHYFMMGDNRDRSADSRVLRQVGYVPLTNIIGKVRFRYFSMLDNEQPSKFWLWPTHARWERMFTGVR
jgi:signal peptidase I